MRHEHPPDTTVIEQFNNERLVATCIVLLDDRGGEHHVWFESDEGDSLELTEYKHPDDHRVTDGLGINSELVMEAIGIVEERHGDVRVPDYLPTED